MTPSPGGRLPDGPGDSWAERLAPSGFSRGRAWRRIPDGAALWHGTMHLGSEGPSWVLLKFPRGASNFPSAL